MLVNGCCLCKKEAEMCDHLLLHCPAVHELWCSIFRLIGVNWVMSGLVREELGAWAGLGKGKKKLVNLIPFTVFWIVWKGRNDMIFKGVENDYTKIRDRWIYLFWVFNIGA